MVSRFYRELVDVVEENQKRSDQHRKKMKKKRESAYMKSQEEITEYQKKYGSKNRRSTQELDWSDEKATTLIKKHCNMKTCPNYGLYHDYILTSRPSLMWICKPGNIGFWVPLKRS